MFNHKSPVQTKLIAEENVWILIVVFCNEYLPGHHPALEKYFVVMEGISLGGKLFLYVGLCV